MPSSPSTYHFGIFDYDATLRARRLPAKQGEAALAGGYSFPNVHYRWDTGESVYDFTVTDLVPTLRTDHMAEVQPKKQAA